jgi:hypothetical protein
MEKVIALPPALPSCFPAKEAPRALSVYTFLRSFSRMLHLSPFRVRTTLTFVSRQLHKASNKLPCNTLTTADPPRVHPLFPLSISLPLSLSPSLSLSLSPQATGFLTALALRLPSLLLAEAHVALLRILEPVHRVATEGDMRALVLST